MVSLQPVLATVNFRSEGLSGWLLVGLLAGWIASKIMGEGGLGLLGDIVVGVVWSGSVGLLGSIVVAFVGACLLLWLLRVMAGRRVVARR